MRSRPERQKQNQQMRKESKAQSPCRPSRVRPSILVVSPKSWVCGLCFLQADTIGRVNSSLISSLHSSLFLTAVLRTLAALSTTFTTLLAQETTAQDRQARHQATAVLLLLRRRLLWRRLLVAHGRLLVAILLGWGRAVAGLLLVLAWGRAFVRCVLAGIHCLPFVRLRELAPP